MKLKELLKTTPVRKTTADLEAEIAGVAYDSRTVKPGDVFVAVRGLASDGHKFIPMAAEKGAACVICEEAPETDIPYVVVEDSRRALAAVSAELFGRPADKMKIIGVTGTNGKTTTTNLIKTMLERIYDAKVGLIGTNCNMIGSEVIETERTTPESYELQKLLGQMAEKGCQYVVMEVSSHALCLDRVYGMTFEAGIFTNLTRDHLDFHKTMEAYAQAKALLFRQSRLGIVNIDDEWAETVMKDAPCPIFTYSAKQDSADLTARNIVLNPDGVSFAALSTGRLEKVRLSIPGMFSVYNALAAMSALMAVGADIAEAAGAMSECRGVMGRAEVVPTGRDFTVLIDYAHTPDALENILKTVRGFAPGRVVLLFGCGGDRDRTKRPIMGKIARSLADFVIVTSDNPRTEEPGEIIKVILAGMTEEGADYTVIENRREAIKWAIKNASAGDTVILAGKGHETYQIIGTEKRHFDEREVVRQALGEL